MAKFKGAVKKCEQCGAEFKVPSCRANTAKSCSHACAVIQRGLSKQKRGVVICKGCGLNFEVPQCHVARTVYCSKSCMEASPEIKALKAARRGAKNPMWKGGRIKRKDGYIYLHVPDHPFSHDNYVLEHRALMERWLIENDPASPFLVEIGGAPFLSPEFEVHHKDLSRSNNAIKNLQCMTFKDHRALHRKITKAALAFYREHVLLKN